MGDFENTNEFLKRSVHRVKQLSSKGGGIFCYLMLFAFFVILVTWWMIR